MTELIPIKEYAIKHEKAESSVRRMCLRGSFKTARKIGHYWVIEADEPYPDNRVRSGKYINWRKKKQD